MLIAIILLALVVAVVFLFWQDISKEGNDNQKANITLEKAEDYLSNKENEKAIEAYNSLLEQGAPSQDIFIGLGVAHFNNLQYQEAKNYFYRAIVIDSSNNQKRSKAYSYLALIAEREKEWDLAMEYSLRAKDLFFQNTTPDVYFPPEFSMILINCAIEKGDVDMAEKYIAEMESSTIKLSPEYKALILKQKGLIAIHRGNYQLAREYFSNALQSLDNLSRQTDKSDVKYGMVISLFGLGEYEEVINFTNQEKEDFFSNGSLDLVRSSIYSVGVSNIKMDNLEKAEELFDRTQRIRLSLHPNYFYEHFAYAALVHYSNGILAIAKNDKDQALLSFEKAVEVIDQISPRKYETFSFSQSATIKFIDLLSLYELANLSGNQEIIQKANNLVDSLSAEELNFVSTRRVGNGGSIIEKIRESRI